MTLSCVNHTAQIYDRGGMRKIADLTPVTQVRWGRVRDTISVGRAVVSNPSLRCRQELGLVEAGRHELVIFRGGHRVWEGPITRITYHRDSVEFDAHDVMHYVNRTVMRGEYDNRYPNNTKVLNRVQRIMSTELARKEALDPPANVLAHVRYLAAGDDAIYPGRYYDTTALVSAVRASTSVAEINNLLQPMQQDYGFRVEFGVAGPSYQEYGIDWDAPKMTDSEIKEAVVAGVQALAKYPPEFFRALNLSGFWFTKNLRQTYRPTWNIGGLATDRMLFIDIADLHSSPPLESIIHHELNHLMWMHFAAEQTQMTKDWMACNPPGFAYSGDNYMNPPYSGERPVGFTRDYGRASVMEDIAEVAGAVMGSVLRRQFNEWTAQDVYLARKAALFKAWIGRVSGGLVGPEQAYFDAVAGSKSVTVVGPSGVRDAGTAAHTLPHEMTVFEHVDNFAQRGGLDYTVVGRSVLFFDVRKNIGQTPPVTAEDFLGDIIITQYGMELATRVEHTDGKGNFGFAGGVDPYYGEWETLYQAYDEDAERDGDEPPSVAELTSQAVRTWNQSKRPPLVVRVPDNTSLNPNGVLSIDDLVPGVLIPMSAQLPGRSLSQMQKLDSISVEESTDGGERISVVMSPAPGNEYAEEDEI